ncbi:hypothetical protein ACH4TS_06955 [Streptomyces albidoflavus]
MPTPALTLRHYTHDELPQIGQTLIDTQRDVTPGWVREPWRKTGTAELLHRTLMGTREDDLAVLLVDVTHPKVQALYESWGYRKVGEDQPFPDSPVFAVMMAELPLS